MSKNPYLIGQVVQNPEMFFGRRQEFALLQEHIRQKMSVAVIGARRIGKSSLLFQLAYQTRRRSDSFLLVYLDLHETRFHTISGLLSMILKRLDVRVHRKYRFDHVRGMREFVEAINKIHNDGYSAVLCLDEIDLLLKHSHFDHEFFEAWYQLACDGKLLFVTASRYPLADVIRSNGNPMRFCELFTSLGLIGLSQNDARVFLTQPFRRERTRRILPPHYIQTALKLTGGHPYFLQIAGALLWEHGAIDPSLWYEKFIVLAEQPLHDLWNELSQEEQMVASYIAKNNTTLPENWLSIQTNLLRLGVLELNDRSRYYLFTPLLEEWIKDGQLDKKTSNDHTTDELTVEHRPKISDVNKTMLSSYLLIGLLFSTTLTWVASQFLFDTTSYLSVIFITSLLLSFFIINQATKGKLLLWVTKWRE